MHRRFSTLLYILSRLVGVPRSEYVGRWLGIDPLRSTFYLMIKDKIRSGEITYYEFGVGWGGTLSRYLDALQAYCRESGTDPYKHGIYLFDSFEGLPEKQSAKDDHPGWKKGTFATPLSQVRRTIADQGISPDRGNIHVVKGFYEKTLTEDLRSELSHHPPVIVTVDVDYFSSCKTVLDWLRPILREGTLFYFDDLWEFYGNPVKGELGAINEFNEAGKGKIIPFPISDMMLFMPGTRYSSLTYAYAEP